MVTVRMRMKEMRSGWTIMLFVAKMAILQADLQFLKAFVSPSSTTEKRNEKTFVKGKALLLIHHWGKNMPNI
jgi:hypothetical protein